MKFDIEPREMIYNRTGQLAQTTTLNQEVAEKFMRVSDLRFDVVIADSDKRPERSAVVVGPDVLAWKTIAPLSELTKMIVRPRTFYELEKVGDQYRILIHDQIIDDDIKKRGYQGKADYEKQYLTRLQAEVKGGLAAALGWEKLGLIQFPNWILYIPLLTSLPSIISEGDLMPLVLYSGLLIFVVHPTIAVFSNIAAQRDLQADRLLREYAPNLRRLTLNPVLNPRDWKHALLPTVPVDKWIAGRVFLAQHGNELISTRD